MNNTFREYYKLSGRSFEKAEAFNAERTDAIKCWNAFVDKVGATSARVDHSGHMRSLLFAGKKVFEGWRKTGSHEKGIECVPHRGSKLGKKLAEEIKLLPKVCDYNTAIDKDVAKAEQFKSGNRIMWTTTQRMSFPKVVYLVSVPRALNDGLEIPKDWVEINEREYSLAFHNHNTEVDRLNSETENAA